MWARRWRRRHKVPFVERLEERDAALQQFRVIVVASAQPFDKRTKQLGVDESVAWGDHFFVEALVKALAGRSDAAW